MNLIEAIKSGAKVKRALSDVIWQANDTYFDATGINEGDCLTLDDMLAEDWLIVSREVSAEDIANAAARIDSALLNSFVPDLTKELGLSNV